MPSVEEFKSKSLEKPDDIEATFIELLSYAARLETKVALLEYRKYGRSSEKFTDPNQGSLFNEVEDTADASDQEGDVDLGPGSESRDKKKRSTKRAKKLDLPEDLPCETHHHDLREDEKKCDGCGKEMERIGEDVTEKVDVIPARVIARRDVYPKYACRDSNCRGTPKQKPRSQTALGRVMATATILSFIAAQKYHFGIPLYRLEGYFSNLGVGISRALMSIWMIRVAETLKPLYLTLEEKLLERPYLHMDETGVQVLDEPGKAATTKSFMWVRRTGESTGPPIVLFHYSDSRRAEVAAQLLAGFKGYLHTDDYAGYGAIASSRDHIIQVLCWDHTRRYFWDAYQAIPKKKRKNCTAEQILKLIKKIYKVEKQVKGQTDAAILKARQEESKVAMKKIKTLAEKHRPNLSSDSPTAKGIDYMLDNWDGLQVFLENPSLVISNSPVEQAIRPFATGRKAWLFSKTPRGAEASAILYSFVSTAKANGWDPFEYFKHAINGMAKVETADDLEALLPTSRMVN